MTKNKLYKQVLEMKQKYLILHSLVLFTIQVDELEACFKILLFQI